MPELQFSPFVWTNLVLAGLLLFSVLAWLVLGRRNSVADKAAAIADVSWSGHLSRFIVAFLGITALTGLLLMQTGWLFDSFDASEALGRKFLDGQSFVGLIGVWIAAPVAFASALYAIYMAHAALQLAKGQTKISESQLALENTVNDPDRPVFVDGVNALLDMDSATMALGTLGYQQLQERAGTMSNRDALRAQLASLLAAINSQALLRFVNRLTGNRRQILERLGELRFALFRANEVNQRMPLSDAPSQGYQTTREWPFEMAEALSEVRREAIRAVAMVRRACREHPSLATLSRVDEAAAALLAESSAQDQLLNGKSYVRSEDTPSFGIVELIDDGQSMEELLKELTKGLEKVDNPIDRLPSMQGELRLWEEQVRDFEVGPKQYCIFANFADLWSLLFSSARADNGQQGSGLGDGLIIVLDTPYGAERECPEVKAKRTADSALQAQRDASIKLTGTDYSEPERIWDVAKRLSRMPDKAELMKRLLASSNAAANSAGRPSQISEGEGIEHWKDVEQLIDLQQRLAKMPIEHLYELAHEHLDISGARIDRLVWINLNVESDCQRNAAGDWWFNFFGNRRYLWLNDAAEDRLQRIKGNP